MEIQIYQIEPDEVYAVAHQHGGTYTGPCARLGFVDGRLSTVDGYPANSATGAQLKGAKTLIRLWGYDPEARLEYTPAAGWSYETPKPEPKPEPKPKPKRKRVRN